MLFNFEMVYKTNSELKYRIGGRLIPEECDKDIFVQVKDEYKRIIDEENISFQDHLVLKDDCILYADIDIISMSNILKILSKNLEFKINPVVDKGCVFKPSSCEPLFKMEINRLFK